MKTVCLLAFGFWALSASAQVPVVEAGGGAAPGRGQAAGQSGNGNELVVTLYNQLETLQEEVQSLRGIVEEQSYQIRRMETDQRDRYLDIDRRLSGGAVPANGAAGGAALPALPGAPQGAAGNTNVPATPQTSFNTTPPAAGAVPVSPPATQSGAPAINTGALAGPSAGGSSAGTMPAAAQMDEQELYRTALALLLEQSQYEESINLFQNYIDTYPQGRLLTNAYYWQGEALILAARFSEAKDVFSRIISEHPGDLKAAGAMLKLGVAYQQLGDQVQAARTWQEIAARYPENLTEINLARDYLNKL